MGRYTIFIWKNKLIFLHIVSFCISSNPTPHRDELLDNQIWLPIDHDSGSTNYMDIGSKLEPSVNPHNDDVVFWNNLYDTYGNPPFDTY